MGVRKLVHPQHLAFLRQGSPHWRPVIKLSMTRKADLLELIRPLVVHLQFSIFWPQARPPVVMVLYARQEAAPPLSKSHAISQGLTHLHSPKEKCKRNLIVWKGPAIRSTTSANWNAKKQEVTKTVGKSSHRRSLPMWSSNTSYPCSSQPVESTSTRKK